jgi:hypothetical protein
MNNATLPTDTRNTPDPTAETAQGNGVPTMRLDLQEDPQVRTKLRLWAILLALYVISLP